MATIPGIHFGVWLLGVGLTGSEPPPGGSNRATYNPEDYAPRESSPPPNPDWGMPKRS